MASLFLRKNKNKKGEITSKIWYIKWYVNGAAQVPISTGCRNKGDANDFFREWDGQGNKRCSIEKLEELITEGLNADNYSYKTKEIYKTVFNDMKQLFPKKKINTFTLYDINKYKNHRKAINKITSVNIYLRTLRSIFEKAVKHKVISRDKVPPIDEIPVNNDTFNSSTNTFEATRQSYTVAEFKSYVKFVLDNPGMFNGINYQIQFYEFCLASFYTGCRRNEVLGILLKNINCDTRIIPVVQTKKRGKYRVKAVPIHPYLWDKVIYRRFYDENGNKRNIDPTEKLINLLPDYVTHKVKDINRAMGLPESLKLHSIRHTYGTELNKAGVDKFSLKDLLGHSSLQSTEVYVEIDTNQLTLSNSRLPALGG